MDIVYFYNQNKVNGFMSNFFPSTFMHDGLIYNCSEQRFIKAKQERYEPDNERLAEAIMNETDPASIKALGRRVGNFDPDDWEGVRESVMYEAVLLKFSQNSVLKRKLLNTNDKTLVEASPTDLIWGIGLSIKDAELGKKWKGKNLLGRVLMSVRSILSVLPTD